MTESELLDKFYKDFGELCEGLPFTTDFCPDILHAIMLRTGIVERLPEAEVQLPDFLPN